MQVRQESSSSSHTARNSSLFGISFNSISVVVLSSLSSIWAQGKTKHFRKKIVKQIIFIGFTTKAIILYTNEEYDAHMHSCVRKIQQLNLTTSQHDTRGISL